ncbi:hypothetical protein MHYP_G00109550 [Metynnis hypsauchen]
MPAEITVFTVSHTLAEVRCKESHCTKEDDAERFCLPADGVMERMPTELQIGCPPGSEQDSLRGTVVPLAREQTAQRTGVD